MRTPSPRAVDVLMATDLRFPGGTTASVVEEIRAQHRAGYRTGLLHLPSAIQRDGAGFAPRIRAVIESGLAELVLDGPVHAKVLVVRHPSVLTALPSWLPEVTADQVLIVANQVPVDPRAHTPYYDVPATHRTARAFSTAEPVWAPIGPNVREALAAFTGAVPLLESDWTNIIDVDAWYTPRAGLVGRRPVLGRHTRGHWSKWPADRETLLAAYPDDPRYVVQVLGGTEAPRDLLGRLPGNWVDLPFNSVPPARFLATTDFVVYYHHPTLIEAFGRTVLEGAASGAVTIVDPAFQPTFGPACRYAAPHQVRAVVDELSENLSAYRRQSEQAVAHIRAEFSYEAHAARLAALIGPAPADPPSGGGAAQTATGAASAAPPGAGRTLIVDLGDSTAVDADLVHLVTEGDGAQVASTPVVLLPAAEVTGDLHQIAEVETIPAVAAALPVAERQRYLRARIEGILTTRDALTQVVLAGDPTTVRSAIPQGVDLRIAHRTQGDTPWRLEAPVQGTAAPAPITRSARDLAQRGANLVRQRAPAAVVRAGVVAKRTGRALYARSLERLAPAGALLMNRTAIPRLPTPPSAVTADRPTALFVITDRSVPAEESLRAIVQRAVVSNAFRPVLLAPVDWVEPTSRWGVALETLVLQENRVREYTGRRSSYLRRRTAEAVQAFQPAAAVTIGGGPGVSSNSLTEALDVAEELSTQRTASGSTE